MYQILKKIQTETVSNFLWKIQTEVGSNFMKKTRQKFKNFQFDTCYNFDTFYIMKRIKLFQSEFEKTKFFFER